MRLLPTAEAVLGQRRPEQQNWAGGAGSELPGALLSPPAGAGDAERPPVAPLAQLRRLPPLTGDFFGGEEHLGRGICALIRAPQRPRSPGSRRTGQTRLSSGFSRCKVNSSGWDEPGVFSGVPSL